MSAGGQKTRREGDAPLVEARHLGKLYVQRRPASRSVFTVRALDDASLAIARGGTVALIGESGSGKSTLARCLALLDEPTTGDIWFDGRNLRESGGKDRRAMRSQVQLVFQDSASALNPRMTAIDIVAEPLAIQKRGTKSERADRALAWITRLGLPADSGRKHAMEFSGGQRQRLAIARALILEPQFLIFDEALSGLDLGSQGAVVELLAELQAVHKLTYLHVSHDLALASQLADEIAVMHEGRVIEQQPAAQLLSDPKEAYTRALLLAMPSLESIYAQRYA